MKVKVNKKKTVLLIFLILIVFICGNAFAALVGAPNIFFAIKDMVSTEEKKGAEEILSDRDITISYSPIKIKEGLEIQVNRILIEESKSTLFITLENKNKDKDKETIGINVYDMLENNNTNDVLSEDKFLVSAESKENFEIELNKKVSEDEKLKLEIIVSEKAIARNIILNLASKEIVVEGKEETKKISEKELKEYLSCFSVLNYEDLKMNDRLIYVAEQMNSDIFKDEMKTKSKRELVMAIVDSFYNEEYESETVNGEKILKPDNQHYDYDEELDSYMSLTEGSELPIGKCLEVKEINYADGIYTVEFVYILPKYIEIDNDTLEDSQQYQATIELKLNENSEYSKYKVISLTESVKLAKSEKVPVDNIKEENTLYDEKNNAEYKKISSNNEPESNDKQESNVGSEKLIQFDNAFSKIEEVAKEYREYKKIKNYKDFEYDFDGDGKKDIVTIEHEKGTEEDRYAIKFNGETFLTSEYYDKLYVVDLNENDKNIEVVIFTPGPSDDPTYMIYSQKGNKMEFVNSIYGLDFKTDKEGTIIVKNAYNETTSPKVYFDYHFIKDSKIEEKNIDLSKVKDIELTLGASGLFFSKDYDNLKRFYENAGLVVDKLEEYNIEKLAENTTFKILDVEKVTGAFDIPEYKISVELSNGQKGYIFEVRLAG